MFRNRKRQASNNNNGLPIMSDNVAPSAHYFPVLGSTSSSYSTLPDGSAKAIRTEAPVVQAWKRSSGYTKKTYYALLVCMLIIWIGSQWLKWCHSSVSLNCTEEACILSIIPHGYYKHGNPQVTLSRNQLVSVQAIKVTQNGDYVEASPRLDNFQDGTVPAKYKKKHQQQKTKYKGPDQKGHYPSYQITFRQDSFTSNKNNSNNSNNSNEEDVNQPVAKAASSWIMFQPFMETTSHGQDNAVFGTLILRKLFIYPSRHHVKTTVQKIDSYIKGRRNRINITQSSTPAWQGVVLVVLGIFGILLTLLIGQFADPEQMTRTRTPSSNRSNYNRPVPHHASQRSKAY